jgi:hypothetical protein
MLLEGRIETITIIKVFVPDMPFGLDTAAERVNFINICPDPPPTRPTVAFETNCQVASEFFEKALRNFF